MKNRFDLNLYRFLTALHRFGSQVKVCHDLDISRATFNRHLSDCRDSLGDELFVVAKGVYTPTLFTNQLIDYITLPLQQLDQVPLVAKRFDHGEPNLEFLFYVVNPLSRLVTLPLVSDLTTLATPQISFMDWSLDRIEFPKPDTLAVGIAGYPNEFNENIIERKVGAVGLYLYANQEHPLAQFDTLDLSQLIDCKTVRISMGAFDSSAYYERIRKNVGISLVQSLTVASLGSAMDCVAGGEHVLVCFEVGKALPDSVKKIPLLLDGEQMRYDVGIHYHRVNYQHPIMNKIESVIRNTLASL
ncbi:LysR family transcriptional regulator [Vibrio aquaticus]|uniref:LysR family transcriptional regulator n=1 Tax=Vibrio aquaticus TaxID=2496559 RepID=A0A3S0ML00_9VIBR|nr:LysR family transcriptional regulator [Vibrio aquaticus]RTZ17483.1 LysR family transcriptional regulator [Vibrio aquaticus]